MEAIKMTRTVNRIDIATQTLGEIIIPRLTNLDKPNIGLPYDFTRIGKTIGNLLDNGNLSGSWTATNWGAGLDFYVYHIILVMITPNAPTYALHNGFSLRIFIDETAEYLLAKSLQPFWIENTIGDYEYHQTWLLPMGVKVLKTQTIKADFYNYSGVTINNVYMGIHGVTI